MLGFDAAQFIGADPRPTFVLKQDIASKGTRDPSDLRNGAAQAELSDGFRIHYSNAAFRSQHEQRVLSSDDGGDSNGFRTWAATFATSDSTYSFEGNIWTAFETTVDSARYRIVSGQHGTPKQKPQSNGPTIAPSGSSDASDSIDRGTLRKHIRLTTPELDKHLEFIEAVDWSRAGYGNIGSWPAEVLGLVNMVLMLPRPAMLFLGDQKLLLYNTTYGEWIAAPRHPEMLGLPAHEAFPDAQYERDTSFRAIEEKGYIEYDQPTLVVNLGLESSEEKYCKWTMVSLGEQLKGILCLADDVTSTVMSERRRGTIAKLRETAGSTDYLSFCEDAASKVCGANPHDVPFMLFYTFNKDLMEPALQAYAPAKPLPTTASISKIFEDATKAEHSLFLSDTDGSLPSEWQDLGRHHGHKDKTCTAIMSRLPISAGSEDIDSVVIVGLNSRRPLDGEHLNFAEDLIKELSACSSAAKRRDEGERLLRITAKASATKSQKLESFTRMLENSDVGLFEYEPSGKLVKANDAWYNLSGHPKDLEAHQDFSFMDVVYPEDVAIVTAAWNQLAVDHKPITFEMRWKFTKELDAVQREELGGQWVVASCIPLLDDKGELDSISGVMYNIEAQKRSTLDALQRAEALEKARHTEEQFRLFADNSPVGIYSFDARRDLSYCNSMFFTITGCTPGPTVDYRSYTSDEDIPAIEKAWVDVIEHKKNVSNQFRLKRKWRNVDGLESEAWAIASSYPVLDAKGDVAFVQGAIFDISSLKWAETIQKVRVEEALEAKRQQEHFIDMTSHELRNPLSAVVQCADSTLESLTQISLQVQKMPGGGTPEVAAGLSKIKAEVEAALDAVRTIESCSAHQKRIIDDILTLSKLDAKLLSINPAPVHIMDAVKACTKMFQSAAQSVDVALEVAADKSLDDLAIDYVSVDASRIDQIIINLLTNAIKFTQNEATRKITVALGASKERPDTCGNVEFAHETISKGLPSSTGEKIFLWCSVTDTGSGLSPEQQSLLFNRFSQAFAPRTHVKYGGSGLGLFISRSLCELQGGEINVYSAGPGHGSTFAFYVTAYTASAPRTEEEEAVSDAAAAIRELHIEQRVSTVLIVEDNIVNQKVLSKQLKKHGFEIHVAGHGGEAIDFLRTTKWWRGNENGGDLTVVLMDVEMPVMNGLECARAIRRFQVSGDIVSHIPIIAVSANARHEQMEETRAAGMDDAIAKPFRIPDLIPKIERLARRASLTRTLSS